MDSRSTVSQAPSIVLVGADKGGVGKTTVTRGLLAFLAQNDVPAKVFDTEAPQGVLKRFHPNETQVVDISSSKDQMRIIDTLYDRRGMLTVVDLRAGVFMRTLQLFENNGLFEAARNGDIHLTILHVLGPSIASLSEVSDALACVGDIPYCLVKNHINDTSYFDWLPQIADQYIKGKSQIIDISIPKLDEIACEQVELRAVPFQEFVESRSFRQRSVDTSFVLRGYVRNWLRELTREFERVRLLDILTTARVSAELV